MQIHLIGIRDLPDHRIIKRLSLYEVTLWGRDSESVVRITKSPYYRFFFFFFKKIYENFVGTLETVRNREMSLLERCPYQEVRL